MTLSGSGRSILTNGSGHLNGCTSGSKTENSLSMTDGPSLISRSHRKTFLAFGSDIQVIRMTDKKTLDALTRQAFARSLIAIYRSRGIATLKCENSSRNGVI